MIPCLPVPEPPDFDEKARQPGNAWLASHPNASRPRDYWSPFRGLLAEGFKCLCGYSAMWIPDGTVDHFLSWQNYKHLAYEWDNYRYIAGWINSSKKTLDDQVLDPLEVEANWFEIILPSLQLVLTDAVPPNMRAKAEFTLNQLHLGDDERVIRQRQAWYSLYLEGELTLEGLERMAPLIAYAIRNQQNSTSDRAN